MPTLKALRDAALTCIAMLAIHAPALAQPDGGSAQATNRALLNALLERRADVARSASSAQDNRAALDFLDQRIAEVKTRIGR